MKARQKPTLEVVTNVAVLLAAAAFISGLSWGYFVRQQTPVLRSGLQRGRVLTPLRGVDFANSERVLLIALGARCQPCADGVPFYNRLAELERRESRGTRIVALFREQEDMARQYVRRNGLDTAIPVITGADMGGLEVDLPPALILLDGQGTVLDFWVGKLPEETRREVIRSLFAPGQAD